MTKTSSTDKAQAEIAATAPTGPAPTGLQGAPAGAVQTGDNYVEPLAGGRRREGGSSAPFAFIDGVLVARDPVVLTPQRVAQPDALEGAKKG